MGEIRVKLSDEAHKKLNILCTLLKKTQDEIIERLIMEKRLPMDIDFLIADTNPEIYEVKKPKSSSVEPFEVD